MYLLYKKNIFEKEKDKLRYKLDFYANAILWVLVKKPQERRTFGRLKRRWEDNIKTDPPKRNGEAQTGFLWLRIGRGGGLL